MFQMLLTFKEMRETDSLGQRVIGFDSFVLARLGRNYLFTELKRLIHISYRDLQTILFLKLEHTVRDSCLMKWRKCVLRYILLFLC